jgi:hypothetical protein
MGLFRSAPPSSPLAPFHGKGPFPILPVDQSKRYDVHISGHGHDRVYENVLFVGIRTFDRISEFGYGHGFLEIEAADGTRCLLPTFGINLICEHGAEPAFKIVRRERGES